jgi:nucleoside-diphosphate-sugar epimerase/glycosyltransferase involved in cell wall biosynthesis/SAM-dependent methyltransferase
MKVLVTGSSGLIGSEQVGYFAPRAELVVGIDNNMRADFFGREGDTTWNLRRLLAASNNFRHADLDIRDRQGLWRLFRRQGPFDLIIHCAAQPSHDLAARRPLDDFDVNAVGTVNMLQVTRELSPEAVFVLLSTNKVYGDAPNELPLVELETRWDYARPEDRDGITEEMRIDRSKHSLFGAGKVAADVMTQEYGRYFGMRTAVLRGGCLTGPNHSGVELHGFLSYLVKTQLMGRTYKIFGHKGKQVRDNIHSLDVARAVEAIYRAPRCGEVYNMGGGRQNACSILEAFAHVEDLTGRKMASEYQDQAREGDHICYISNLDKFKSHYPEWQLSKSLDDIFREVVAAWTVRLASEPASDDSPRKTTPAQPETQSSPDRAMIETLADRERLRDEYFSRNDPIAADRLTWRAQSLRHLVHLLPGQTILELNGGHGLLAQPLHRVTRGESPITVITFDPNGRRPDDLPADVEYLRADALPGPLESRRFDFVVAMDVLDGRNSAWLLNQVHELLKPGGEAIFYESNPWNPVVWVRRVFARLTGNRDTRQLLSRSNLYELISELGLIRAFAVHNDFCYSPLTKRMAWLFRNASILLENLPGVRRLSGSIIVHAQKPPRVIERQRASLADHECLKGAISVVIPCHNEEMNIIPLVRGLQDHFGPYLHEIIPVDDNSKDNTAAVIAKLAAEEPDLIKPVYRKPPNGVGRAIADGYKAATGDWILSMDCDFQHLLPEIRDLFDAAAQGYDVVLGSRFSRHSVLLNYPFQKIMANRGFHLLAQIALGRRCRDVTNNLKLMRREVIQMLRLRQPGFAVNAETGLQPLVMGCKIKEVPISWINRTPDMGTSSFKLVKVGGGYWQVLWNLWRGVVLKRGPYKDLADLGGNRRTSRDPASHEVPRAIDIGDVKKVA